MSGWTLTPVQALAGLTAALVVLWVCRSSARRARLAAEHARSGTRLFSLVGRTVVVAIAVCGGQWLALTHPSSTWAVKAGALLLPALLASGTLVRALTISSGTSRRDRSGGGRR